MRIVEAQSNEQLVNEKFVLILMKLGTTQRFKVPNVQNNNNKPEPEIKE